MTLIQVKGHEPKQYYALWFIAGLLYNFTSVKMKGPNKTLRTKKIISSAISLAMSFSRESDVHYLSLA